MDKLDQEIADKRLKLSELLARTDDLKREISILERAASLRPTAGVLADFGLAPPVSPENKVNVVPQPATRGKPEGAISKAWRQVLKELSVSTFTFRDFCAHSERFDIKSSESSKRDRLRIFIAQEFVSEDDVDRYKITEKAATRFGFDPRKIEIFG